MTTRRAFLAAGALAAVETTSRAEGVSSSKNCARHEQFSADAATAALLAEADRQGVRLIRFGRQILASPRPRDAARLRQLKQAAIEAAGRDRVLAAIGRVEAV